MTGAQLSLWCTLHLKQRRKFWKFECIALSNNFLNPTHLKQFDAKPLWNGATDSLLVPLAKEWPMTGIVHLPHWRQNCGGWELAEPQPLPVPAGGCWPLCAPWRVPRPRLRPLPLWKEKEPLSFCISEPDWDCQSRNGRLIGGPQNSNVFLTS